MHRLFERWGGSTRCRDDPGLPPDLVQENTRQGEAAFCRWQGDPGRYHGDPSLSSADLHTQGVASAWMRTREALICVLSEFNTRCGIVTRHFAIASQRAKEVQ